MAEKAGVLEPLGQPDSGLLTSREWEVAGLVSQGLANKAIAHRLYLSRATIASHVAKILHKLNFDSRVQIAAWIVERRQPAQPTQRGGRRDHSHGDKTVVPTSRLPGRN
jgi:DNA-binding NarL/FixJ family response regulator